MKAISKLVCLLSVCFLMIPSSCIFDNDCEEATLNEITYYQKIDLDNYPDVTNNFDDRVAVERISSDEFLINIDLAEFNICENSFIAAELTALTDDRYGNQQYRDFDVRYLDSNRQLGVVNARKSLAATRCYWAAVGEWIYEGGEPEIRIYAKHGASYVPPTDLKIVISIWEN